MAEYAGTFEDDPMLKKHLEYSRNLAHPKSQLLAQTVNRFIGDGRTPEDMQLFIQMVSQVKNIIEKRYKAKFIVVLWPLGDKDSNIVIARLKSAGIEVITVDQIFQEYKESPNIYMIAYDNHPTKLGNERIAHYLLSYLQ
jgi:ABC-type xylose transport system substrate-binding protein